ncbi:antitoxin family protein [Pyrococcus kukulkanii]|uniref:Antitoxin n=1 Tax=Pyrococcus kukulkanii TaxID=1609559 RepID=A0A127B9M5_9EURY|nr:antitoxin family protein [Pyrococcus kukulkanii]AMM53925.1 hypothetical protein TQ32_05095 [Pyrococcus kukulkanii]
MITLKAIYEKGVLKLEKKLNIPDKRTVKVIIIDEFAKDLEDVFGLFKEEIDLEELRKEWDRDVSN